METLPHTPGPWHADRIVNEMAWVLAGEKGPRALTGSLPRVDYLAEMVDQDGEGMFIKDQEERWANARLMAAAPALLEQLQHTLGVLANRSVLTPEQEAIEIGVEIIRIKEVISKI